MLNRVILQGRLVADPELRHTQNNIAVATYRIAVDRNYATRDANGNRQTQADFINIVSWRQSAEFVAKYFTKGRMILVEGQLQVRDYTDRDGNRRYVTEVVTDNINFCDSRRDNQSSGGYNQPSGGYGQSGGYGATAAPSSYAPQTAAPANEFAELNDDDGELPF
ncbi:MAG: single-stranded DNA-binding protein [Clostridiales bacterium]|nr:single-stranded DNA-binding protein [Clostridiales bacterium]MCD8368161.1 single-stranded DNA-binding protein [Clostridiales bacterium]